ncbi:hypothetical protein FNYG_09991 [Fusarium nygamai]|uniref:Reverse transcriptase domain-containing protein n=1 Tax=Gibberella nygamai TaxID=42673 RepID=A0A2K0W2S0_GIBNY|nr:hypothetical protein FNYG_09991 [Fusarium nygamai]
MLLRISDDQTIAIRNVYNQRKHVHIPGLLQKVTGTGEGFLVSDFNLHHPVWGGNEVTTIEPEAIELANGLDQAGMELLTTRGFRTYARGKCYAGEYSSTIDLTYASPSLVPFVREWQSPDVPGFDSDHRVIMTTLNLELNQVPCTYYIWKRADPDDPERVPSVVSQDMEMSEVKRLIAGAPTGKAAGPDLLTYEGMKMAQEELLPYLHHLFAACLKLGHHPAAFKQACTVMLRKAGKDDYEQPKSWRPVALLPCMGKLLEKIFTYRLKQLAVEHNLLPDVQFGTPGKCTTKALQYLLNNVYSAWTGKFRRLATIMGLDITGAYDRVERVKLMKILQDTGLPEWMLSFIWSFLTDRSTDMRLPGFTSPSFWVNMGIPQGSPLSPILFLFFSLPIVGAATEYTNPRVKIYPFAYVDDTYLLAVSNSYGDNCKALKECHDRIMEWADSVGVSFSPHKYHVMHFSPPKHSTNPSKLMPNIPGLEGKEPERSMKILGVEVDYKLN